METSPSTAPQLPPPLKFNPNTDRIKQRLLKNGVFPTPKIVHTLRKKEIQKHNRKQKKNATHSQDVFTSAQQEALLGNAHLEKIRREYEEFNKDVNLMVGLPWEGVERVQLRELASGKEDFEIGFLRKERLRELGEMFEGRKREELLWVLEDDHVELDGSIKESEDLLWDPQRIKKRTESEAVKFLVTRLSAREIDRRDWKFSRIMKQSGLEFTEDQLLKILEGLGGERHWKQAMALVDWAYDDKRSHWKSRFVYTKLLAVLGKAKRPKEALRVFKQMLEDFHIYPDMAAYHSIAVTLGQSGLVKELLNLIESLRQKSRKKIKNLRKKSWDPVLEPDLVVYNAVLNACVSSKQWKGVSWVFNQLRMSGLKPNGATYGLAMEVMLQSGQYDLVHEFFRKMKRSGEAPRAITYKVLVTSFWREGKVDEAVEAVRDMERRGVVGTGSVYYELACCLCNNGRWQEAMLEVEKLQRLRHVKPLEVTFTGLILSSMEGGHIDDCISLFNYMKGKCGRSPNIGTINTMIRIYGRNDMFFEAKELFERIKGDRLLPDGYSSGRRDVARVSLIPDEYTYSSMLEACVRALQWEYFEYVYKEMALSQHRLDQTKHASLLVAASQAGKGHLLEHAFDSILEAGEVPEPLLFLEMVFQSTARHNYERAVNLITIMGHASFQVTEKQWTQLFGRNSSRIPSECWENLLSALRDCPLAYEATVTNLVRSLNSLLGRSVDTGEISSSLGVEPEAQSYLFKGQGCDFEDDNLVSLTDSTHNGSKPDMDTRREEDCYVAGKDSSDQLADVEPNGIDSILSTFKLDEDFEEDDDNAEFVTDCSSGEDDIEPDIPSAEEILQMWKEDRAQRRYPGLA